MKRVGFVGAGQMAIAMAKGLARTKTARPSDMIASAPKRGLSKLDEFKQLGVPITYCNKECVEKSDLIFIMTKASVTPAVLREVSTAISSDKMLISVVAGMPLDYLAGPLPADSKVVRSMPNTPMLLGAGAVCYAATESVTREEKRLVEKLFSAVGFVREVPETLMDAVCGLSGSGPAYVYMFIEAMTDGGVRMGLPRDLAARLAVETVLGSARMVKETEGHPAELKDAVCSPGGSTIAAVHSLDCSGFRGLVIDAVRNATLRTTEMARDLKHSVDNGNKP